MRHLPSLRAVAAPYHWLVQFSVWCLSSIDRLFRGRAGDPCVICGRPIERPDLDRVCSRSTCQQEIADRLAW